MRNLINRSYQLHMAKKEAKMAGKGKNKDTKAPASPQTAIPAEYDQSDDANAGVQGVVDNHHQERGADVEQETARRQDAEESRSAMKPSPVYPHGSKAVDTDKKRK